MDYPVKTPLQLRPLLVGFRKAAGFTQAQVASRLGVAQQTYAQLEARPESASIDRLFQIFKLLKVDIVLAQTTRVPGHMRAVSPPASVKQSAAKKRPSPVAAKTAATRKVAAVTPVRNSAQGATKPIAQPITRPMARKRAAPVVAASKKREEW